MSRRPEFVSPVLRSESQALPAVTPRGYLNQPWQSRLESVMELMRTVSSTKSPQEMVQAYGQRVREMIGNDGFIAVSRRGMTAPAYKITRATAWAEAIDPWTESHRLPVHDTGILGEWLYKQQALVDNDFTCPPGDPCEPLFLSARSVAIVPQFDGGVAMNLTVLISRHPGAFDPDRFPEMVWQSNLFGRATNNMVLSGQLQAALAQLERETRVISDIQRSLLPEVDPSCTDIQVATHYQTSRSAGGDYYDFFELPDDRLGILIADVAGHGTPAAVLMAIMHAIAHLPPAGVSVEPREWMRNVNEQLCDKYVRVGGTFVTAFYGVFDPATGQFSYASAGHNPPRLRIKNRACALSPVGEASTFSEGSSLVLPLDQAQGLPLGIDRDAAYVDATITLSEGDVLCLYTDGITEAMNPQRQLIGDSVLDEALVPDRGHMQDYIDAIMRSVDAHCAGSPPTDDRTLVICRVGPRSGGREPGIQRELIR